MLCVSFSVHCLLVEILMNKFPLFLVNNSVGLNVLERYPSYKALYVIVTTCFVIFIWYWAEIRPSAHSYTLRGFKFFRKGQLQDRFKQLNLEQDPRHNTR